MNLAKGYYYLSDAEFAKLQSIDHDEILTSFIDAELTKADAILAPLGLKAYSETSRTHLLSFPMEIKKRALTKLMDYTSFVSAMQKSCVALKDDRSCLDVIQNKYGLKISKDFMDTIEDGDAIEIIDKDGVQVYRNLELLTLTDYDVLFLCSFEWTDLFDRDPKITQDILGYLRVLLQIYTPLIKIGIVEHLMVEKISDRRLLFSQNHRYGATILNNNDEIVGIVSSMRALPIGDLKNSGIGLLRSY